MITLLNTLSMDRSVWCKPRAQGYWEAAKADVFGDGWWYENLRISKATFGVLCNQLKPYIQKTITSTACQYLLTSKLLLQFGVWQPT